MAAIPIQYRGFWDLPLMFVLKWNGEWLLFDCHFDDEADEYRECYDVYLLGSLPHGFPDVRWTDLPKAAIANLGEVLLRLVHFDRTKRREIDSDVLDLVTPDSV